LNIGVKLEIAGLTSRLPGDVGIAVLGSSDIVRNRFVCWGELWVRICLTYTPPWTNSRPKTYTASLCSIWKRDAQRVSQT
jgi:hypothetical protein